MALCPLCSAADLRRLYTLVEGHATVQCRQCSFVFMSPRPTPDYLNAYYQSAPVYSYTSAKAEDYAAVVADRARLIRRFTEQLPDAARSGIAVDLGAGNGNTVKALETLGYDAIGVELSDEARKAGDALFHVRLQGGDLSAFDPESLSLLTLFDVLEHMLDPVELLTQAYTRLRPGGGLIIGVPNFDAIDRLLTGVRAKALIFPEHVNQFRKGSLRQCVEKSGFATVYIGSPPPYGVAITLGWRRALRQALGDTGLTRAVERTLVWVKRNLVYPVPNFVVEKTGWLGQSLLIVAHKPTTKP